MAPPTSKDALLSEKPTQRRYTDDNTMVSDSDSDYELDDGAAESAPFTTSGKGSTKGKKSAMKKNKKGGFSTTVDIGGGKKKKGTITACALTAGLVAALTVVGLVAGSYGIGPLAYWNLKGLPPGYGYTTEWWGPSPKGGTVQDWKESYAKAQKLVSELTLAEKVNITTGTGWSQGFCVGNTGPAIDPKTGKQRFPSLCLQDGPLGLRFADHATAWPAGLTAGATWNKALIRQRGQLHAREARLKGINALLGPSMGPLGKFPAGGRNWEGFGSDPVLQGIAAAETIHGIQSEHVIATAKHYIANEQERFRQTNEWQIPFSLSSNIEDRTMHELYLWPFADSVKAGVGSIMCSYQQTNNTYSCGNSKLLNGLLKDELGFQGFVMSDWLAQREGVNAILAGLDMTMPGDGLLWQDAVSLMGPVLSRGVLNASIPVERIDDMVTRIVATYYQFNQDDKKLFNGDGPNFSSWTNDKEGHIHFGAGEGPKGVVNKFIDVQGKGKDAHGLVARKIAAEGTVLLKNEGDILPLQRGQWKGKKIGIFGEDAGPGKGRNYCPDRGCNQGTLASGWGSGAVEFPYLVTPLEALERSFNTSKADLPKFSSVLSNYELAEAEETASEQDLCFVFINADAGEGYIADAGIKGDRNDLNAHKDGDDLVVSVASSCSRTIVVVHAVGPILMEEWADHPNVKAILHAHLPGQESGNALVDILFGDENPSGKLPYTIGKTLEDYGPGAQILYDVNAIPPQQNFSDAGLYIDYRHFDKEGITPRYPFGFGLSYTKFRFDKRSLKIETVGKLDELPAPRPSQPLVEPPSYPTDIPSFSEVALPKGFKKLHRYVYPYLDSDETVTAEPGAYPYPIGYETPSTLSPAGGAEGGNPSLWDSLVRVSVDLHNKGPRDGQEVVQLYVSFPEGVKDVAGNDIDFPVRQLRAFEKVEVKNGQKKTVVLDLKRRDLSYWCVIRQNWVLPRGEFKIRVGNSSRDAGVEGKFVAE